MGAAVFMNSALKRNNIILLFHNATFWVFLLDLYYHIYLALLPTKSSFAGEYKYLTIWCLISQVIYYAIASIHDFIFIYNVNQRIYYNVKVIQDYIYLFAFPLALAVGMLFWGIYFYDRELVFPVYMDDYITPWHNHILHTCPVLFMLVDTMLCQHYLPNMYTRIKYISLFVFTYIAWLLWIRYAGGIWAYPIFYVLSNFGIFLFLFGIAVLLITLSVAGEYLSTYYWNFKFTTPSKQQVIASSSHSIKKSA